MIRHSVRFDIQYAHPTITLVHWNITNKITSSSKKFIRIIQHEHTRQIYVMSKCVSWRGISSKSLSPPQLNNMQYSVLCYLPSNVMPSLKVINCRSVYSENRRANFVDFNSLHIWSRESLVLEFSFCNLKKVLKHKRNVKHERSGRRWAIHQYENYKPSELFNCCLNGLYF